MTVLKRDRAPLWAVAGIAAGSLLALSPRVGFAAILTCLGGAVWWARRPEPAPGAPTAGDLALPWPDPVLDGLRQDLITVWNRVHGGSGALNTAMGRLETRLEDWCRLLGDGGANVQTLDQVTHAVRGDLDTAVQALTREWQGLAAWQSGWDGLRRTLQQVVRSHTDRVGELRQWESAWQALDEHRQAVAGAVGMLRLPDTAGVPGLLQGVRQMAAQMATLADEAGRLGKTGWAVALAAVQANEVMSGWVGRAETVLQPWEDAVQSVRRVLALLAAAPAPGLPAPVADPGAWTDPGELAMPDLLPTIERLDRAYRDSELSVGLSSDIVAQIAHLQGQTERLSSALAAARHQASELLILSGYVRTQATTRACHLNRTAWCITDGDCERCPLTRLNEADFPGLLGASATRPQPRIGRTGQTIDLDGRV